MTIAGGDAVRVVTMSARKRHVSLSWWFKVTPFAGKTRSYDDPMVTSLIATNYKIERVLVNHESSTNVLYWSTFQRLRLLISSMEECSRTLFGFAGKQVKIRGSMKIETVFGIGSTERTILVSYTVVNTWASYKMMIR
ncbi:hypothetical protein CR513_51982, partial [Mucuna pruriens]